MTQLLCKEEKRYYCVYSLKSTFLNFYIFVFINFQSLSDYNCQFVKVQTVQNELYFFRLLEKIDTSKFCQNIQPDNTHPTLFTRRLLSLLTGGNHEGKTENIQYKRFFVQSFFLSTSCSKYLLTLPNSKMVYEAGAILKKMLYHGGIFSNIY